MERGEGGRRREHDEHREPSESEEQDREITECIREYERQRKLSEIVNESTGELDEQERSEEKASETEAISEGETSANETDAATEELKQDREQEQNERVEKEQATEYAKEADDEQESEKGEPESESQNAGKELEHEGDESQRDLEQEKMEESRKERVETADKDEYDELEKWVIDTLEEHGIDADELRERWRDRFVEDVEEELESSNTEIEKAESEEHDKEESSDGGRTEEGATVHSDGSGQVYVIEHESKESSEAKGETESETQVDSVEQPQHEKENSEETEQDVRDAAESKHTNVTEDTTSEEVQDSSINESKKPLHETHEEDVSETPRKEERRPELSEHEEQPSTQESESTGETREESESAKAEQEEKERAEHRRSDEFNWSMFPESAEEKRRRVLTELWNELTEKEREEFKRRVREGLQDEEDLAELIERHGLEHTLDDEEAMEEITRYLDFRQRLQEEIENGTELETALEEVAQELGIDHERAEHWADHQELPESLRELYQRETERRWSEYVRSSIEAFYPTSMEEVELLAESRLYFSRDELDVIRKWIEVREKRRSGDIAFIFRDGRELFDLNQVRKLSLEYGIPEREVLLWLRGATPPRIDEIARAKREYFREIAEYQLLSSRKRFEAALKRYPELRLMKTFPKKHNEVVSYFELRDMLDEGYVDLHEFGKAHNIPFDKVSAWARRKSVPNLLETVQDFELRRLYMEHHGQGPIVSIKSMEDVNRLLRLHPGYEKEDYHEVERYFLVLEHQDKPLREIAKIARISPSRAGAYRKGSVPRLLGILRKLEENRIVYEWARKFIISVILGQSIDESHSESAEQDNGISHLSSEIVRQMLPERRNEWSFDDVIMLVERIVRSASGRGSRIIYADLRKELERRDITVLNAFFQSGQKQIAQRIRKDLGFEERGLYLAFVDRQLYIWTPDLSPFNLMNAYRDEYFYFNNRRALVKFLGGIGTASGSLRHTIGHLKKTITQMFGETENILLLESGSRHYRLRGEYVHFLLDLSKRTAKFLEGKIKSIKCVTGVGGINAPRFPDGEHLEVALARLVATMICDGTISWKGQVAYYDASIERVNRVRDNLQSLGSVWFRVVLRDGLYECSMPDMIGNILHECGITSRDKTIQNPKINPDFLNGLSWRALLAFIEDVVPEDGYFLPGRVSITHSVSLHAGDKIDKYAIEPLVGEREVRFIKEHGKKNGSSWRLPFGELRKVIENNEHEHADDVETARRLREAVYRRPNRFILDEKSVFERVGIECKASPISIHFHGKSNSVTVSWRLKTASREEAIRLAILAPPNDEIKRRKMREWLRSIPDRVEEMYRQILKNGVTPRRWWLE